MIKVDLLDDIENNRKIKPIYNKIECYFVPVIFFSEFECRKCSVGVKINVELLKINVDDVYFILVSADRRVVTCGGKYS